MKKLLDFKSRFKILKGGKVSLIVSAMLAGTTLSFAAPSGGVITSGSANISQNASTTNIIQNTNKVTINWNKFSIASGETVNFKQPNVNSIALNRVVGNEKSIINGALNANGQVWLLNSNGILFGTNAKINTAGFLATTKELSDSDFNAGNYNFKGNSTQSVINLGEINISDSGYAALLANSVSNEGIIKAVKGSIRLVGANEAIINLNGNSLVDLKVTKAVLDALVENKGAIYANGGEIYLTTNAVNKLLKGVVNNEGVIEANSLDDLSGKISLASFGGEIANSGTLKASSTNSSGGKITLEADKITVKENSILDVSGATAGGEIYVGGGWQGKDSSLYNASDVQVDKNAFIDASALQNGNGGKIVFWSNNAMRFAGEIKATGGEIFGNGGKVEVSGKEKLWFLGKTNLISANGENGLLFLDPSTITIVDGSSGQTGTYPDWSTHGVSGSYVIPETVLEALTGDVVLTANTDIIIEDLSDNELTLSASNMYFYANDESGGSSSGGFIMRDINDTIFLNQGSGHELVFQGGNISNEGTAPASAIYLGNIKTSGANIVFNTKRSYAATPIIVKGNITTNGGNVTVEPGTRFGLINSNIVDVQLDGLVNTSGGNFTSNMIGQVNVNGGMNLGNGIATFGGTNTNINSVITSTANVNINTPLNFGVGSGITTNGIITFGGVANMLNGGDLTLTATNFIFNDTFNGNNSKITLKPYLANTNIDLGASGIGNMTITSDTLNKLSNFNNIVIGRSDATGTTTIVQNTAVNTNRLDLINKKINLTGGTLTNTGEIVLTGDLFDLSNRVTSTTTSKISIEQLTSGSNINLGGSSVVNINNVIADYLEIGNDNSGDVIFVSDLATQAKTIHIKSGGKIIGTDGGVAAENLALSAKEDITLSDDTFNYRKLALDTMGNVNITKNGNFTIDSIDGVVGAKTSGNITFNVNGILSQNQVITSNNLILQNSNGSYNLNSNNVINYLKANVGNLVFSNSKDLSLSSIKSQNKIDISTTFGNIDINSDITANSSASDALIINAAKNKNIGNITGGNIIYNRGLIKTGVNGRATLYSGAYIENSSLNKLVSSNAYRRFNSDETTTTPTINAKGTFIVYREDVQIEIPPIPIVEEKKDNTNVNKIVENIIKNNEIKLPKIDLQVTKPIGNKIVASSKDNQELQKIDGINLQNKKIAINENSIIKLVNGGVNLPAGVNQEFYTLKNNERGNN